MIADLDRTEAIYAQALASYGSARTWQFSFAEADRLGYPLWSVVHLAEDGMLADGFGYGGSWQTARVSALGEALEWLLARRKLITCERRLGSFNEMTAQGFTVVDPVELNLPAGSNYHPGFSPVEWLEVIGPDGAAWMPIEFAAPRFGDLGNHPRREERLSVPITNGLGVGTSLSYAMAHGILELLQRDGNSVSYRALDQGVAVELDNVKSPSVRSLVQRLDQDGIEVIVKLAGYDFGIPNLYVVGYDRDLGRTIHPISLSGCGEAAHPDREIALEKALYEFVSARARKAFNHCSLEDLKNLAPADYLTYFNSSVFRNEDERAYREMRAWSELSAADFYQLLADPIYRVRSVVRFSELPTLPQSEIADPEALLYLLKSRLGDAGYDIYYADFSDSKVGVSAVKVIIPGLEVETMTYHRIGRRNLDRLLHRHSSLVGTGSRKPDSARWIRLPEHSPCQPAWFDTGRADACLGRLYPLYREPGRHVLAFSH